MCLVVVAWRSHPRYPLLVAANRDEFHARPSAPLGWWEDEPSILGGRDLVAGGTWLALGRQGRFATVTNYREASRSRPGERSRGELVRNFVSGREHPMHYLRSLDGAQYAGFSLLVATPESLAYFSNRGDAASELRPGIYGLSNAALDTPWPKVERSKARLARLLEADEVMPEPLFELLGDRQTAGLDDAGSNDLPPPLARAVTAPFIVAPEFGTRCSTVLAVDASGNVSVEERSYDSDGRETGRLRHTFRLRTTARSATR